MRISGKHSFPSHRGLCVLESTASLIPTRDQRRLDGRTKVVRGPVASAEGMGWRTRSGVCHVCVPGASPRGSHTSQKARRMRHPSREEGFRLCRLSGTKPECALESTVSQSVHLSRIGWRTRGGACYVCVLGLAHRGSQVGDEGSGRRSLPASEWCF